MKKSIEKILLLVLLTIMAVAVAAQANSTEKARQELKKAGSCATDCNQFDCYVEALTNYEEIRRNNPKVKDVKAQNKIDYFKTRCGFSSTQPDEPGGPGNKILDNLRKIILDKENKILIADIEGDILDNEKTDVSAQLEELAAKKIALATEDPQLATLTTQEKELRDSLELLNKRLINNAKSIKELDSSKFKAVDKLFEKLQELRINKNQ